MNTTHDALIGNLALLSKRGALVVNRLYVDGQNANAIGQWQQCIQARGRTRLLRVLAIEGTQRREPTRKGYDEIRHRRGREHFIITLQAYWRKNIHYQISTRKGGAAVKDITVG